RHSRLESFEEELDLARHCTPHLVRRAVNRSPQNATVPLTRACGDSQGTKCPQLRSKKGPTWFGNTLAAIWSNAGYITWSLGPYKISVRVRSLRAESGASTLP